MSNDLEKPLGLDVHKPVRKRGSFGRKLGGGAAALIAVSAVWISLQGMQFSDPQVPEPEKPVVELANSANQTPAPDPKGEPEKPSDVGADEEALARTAQENVSPPLPGGAKIIHVQPQDADTQGVVKITSPG